MTYLELNYTKYTLLKMKELDIVKIYLHYHIQCDIISKIFYQSFLNLNDNLNFY